jgi:hypothetical protein
VFAPVGAVGAVVIAVDVVVLVLVEVEVVWQTRRSRCVWRFDGGS